MKANLNSREPQVEADWEKIELYQKLRQAAKGKKLFILHDGPPYANGHIHIGHALNKILKDIIIRYKSLQGFDTPYIPGWDCHGLPVEHQLFKDLKKTKDQIDRLEFRKLARAYAEKYVSIQREEFKRLGIMGDWEQPYLTMDYGYEKATLESFGQLVEKGYVYRGLKPVNWCLKCETALAEAEVEYADHVSDSVFVKFKIKNDDKAKLLGIPSGKEASIVIWTTTPWTLIANVAVSMHPDLDYLVLLSGEEILILGKGLFENSLAEKFKIKDYKILAQLKGKVLEGLSYEHPFGLREGKVVLADYVSKEDGSGCVHTAPGHGQEDFTTGLKYHLEVIMPVDERGRFDTSAAEFSGQQVFQANELIIEKLRGLKRLILSEKVTHSYPHCWRCKTPIIFRATQQWFLKIDHKDLREKLLKVIKNDVTWIPAAGRERISAMVQTRPDWCLSRQRYWGVPIPAVICGACQKHVLDVRVISALAKCAASEGSDAWFKRELKDFLPKDFRCGCGNDHFDKSMDILDVWFDSGVSHQAVLKDKPALKLPADLYLEGSDQHRGWFQASLIPSMALDGRPPFESVLTHGFVVDGEGRKMSKSMGNVIAPQEVFKDYGADILRLWVLSSDYSEDVKISKEILTSVADAYRKIRNTIRFLLGNLNDYDPEADRLSSSQMLEIDRWALFKLSGLIDEVTEGYQAYKFYHVFQKIYNFCNEEMSSLYLDILKDRLYTSGKKSKNRRSAQTVLYEILKSLNKLLAPVLPFTSEEIYRSIRHEKNDSFESVHFSFWPKLRPEYKITADQVKEISTILNLRPVLLKALEEKRAQGDIGSALEAKIVLTLKDENIFENFMRHAKQLPFIFIVSQVELKINESLKSPFEVVVLPADGKKCARCWNYALDVDSVKDYPGICGRCVEAIVK